MKTKTRTILARTLLNKMVNLHWEHGVNYQYIFIHPLKKTILMKYYLTLKRLSVYKSIYIDFRFIANIKNPALMSKEGYEDYLLGLPV